MDRLERFYRIHEIMQAGQCVPLTRLMDELEISRATAKRDIEYMRDRLRAPLIWDADRRGYRYDSGLTGADNYNLPGLWFESAEIHALVVMHAMLRELAPALLSAKLSPLIQRLEKILETQEMPSAQMHRIRVHNAGNRMSSPACFSTAAQGVLQRRRLAIEHYHRQRDEVSARIVSPQRLTHYRGNWYLDAWCHSKQALRSFSLDAIRRMRLQSTPATEIPAQELDQVLASSYGIFAGAPTQIARLRFSAIRSRWVGQETWHPEQVQKFDQNGALTLSFPYHDDTELVMDILRHAKHVEVLEPAELRTKVREEIEAIRAIYLSAAE